VTQEGGGDEKAGHVDREELVALQLRPAAVDPVVGRHVMWVVANDVERHERHGARRGRHEQREREDEKRDSSRHEREVERRVEEVDTRRAGGDRCACSHAVRRRRRGLSIAPRRRKDMLLG
jgi:hypothetical protein